MYLQSDRCGTEELITLLALAAANVLDTDYLCNEIKENFPLQNALRKVVKNADAYRYKDINLTLGAKRLSLCL